MSDKQPEALRLADELDRVYGYPDTNAAATELRRLYVVNQELFEALDDLLHQAKFSEHEGGWSFDQARTAIAKATGENT